MTDCAWETSGDDVGLTFITIAPRAARLAEQGATLPGVPLDHTGALAASVVVDLDTGYLIDDRPGERAAALRVVDAIVAEFGAP